MLVLVAATVVQFVCALAQGRPEEITTSDALVGLFVAAVMNVVLLAAVAWLAWEALHERRRNAAAAATLMLSAILVLAAVLSHLAFEYDGAAWFVGVQLAVATIALAASGVALRTLVG